MLAIVPIRAGTSDPPQPPEEPVKESEPAAAMLELANRARVRAGLQPLVRTPTLDRVAQAHSQDMLESGFFGHESPITGGPQQRAFAANLRLDIVGENVAREPTAAAVASGHDAESSRGPRRSDTRRKTLR